MKDYVIDYFGHRVTIDVAYSYDRVSSRRQEPDQGGEGLGRQALLRRQFSTTFGVPIDYELSDVRSASNDRYLEDGGVLAGFMELAVAKKLKGAHPALIVESFSRLCRLPIDDALFLFLRIIRAGVTLITLIDKRAYTRASLRGDPGQIHAVTSLLHAARNEAEAKGHYSRESWIARRGRVIDMHPGWMVPNADRTAYVAVEGSKSIFARIFREGENIGDEKVAARMNADEIKPWKVWNHTPTIWYANHIRRIITSRAGRGERIVNGVTYHDYPVMVSEAQWQRTNTARNNRKPTNAGRKGKRYNNLLQHLAKCAHCNKAMKLGGTVKRGKRYQYFRCSNLRRRKCDHPHTYDYAQVEREFIDVFQDIVAVYLARAEAKDDPATPIREQIAAKQAELSQIDREATHVRKTLVTAASQASTSQAAVQSALQLFGFDERKLAVQTKITDLERELDRMQFNVATPDVVRGIQALLAKLGSAPSKAQYELRAKINAQLKRFIARIDFDDRGLMTVVFGERGKPFPKPQYFRSDYAIRFRDDGTVQREDPMFVELRATAAMKAAGQKSPGIRVRRKPGESRRPPIHRPDLLRD